MAREHPNSKKEARQKAFELYKEHNGEMPQTEIAAIVGVAPGTIRKWRIKDKWHLKHFGVESEEDALTGDEKTPEEMLKVKNTKHTQKKMKEAYDKIVEPEDYRDPDGQPLSKIRGQLTDKQKLFIAYYLKYTNATKSYQKAFNVPYSTAISEGSKLMANPRLRAEIKRQKDLMYGSIVLDKMEILQKWVDIALADITDFVDMGVEEVEVFNENTGKVEIKKRSYVNLKDGEEIDGSLVNSVSVGKDGVQIKLADKITALKYLSRYMDVVDERTRDKLIIEQYKLNNKKTKKEIKRLEAANDESQQENTETKLEKYFENLQEAFVKKNDEDEE